MSQKTYLNILKYGVYASLIVVFFVFKNLLFPFITSKQISFNILIEALFILWVAFIVKYPEYRPKKHYIWFGLCAFFFVLILSSIFGVDWNLSFWGDIERMLGVFHLLHFLAFYFIIITVMRRWQDWKIFFISSVAIAILVVFKGVADKINYATIGNTAYVSGYLIFNMYFCLLLFWKERNPIVRWLYPAAIIPLMYGFVSANTTGAYVGLGTSLLVLAFFYGLLNKNKKLKIATLAVFLLGTVFVVNFFIFNRDNFLTQHNKWFRNLTAEVNINKRTFQTRLVSWRAAIKAFPEHPILGTGHGNYAVIFDKYFDPIFYKYSRGETYFDRAHNNIIDIASTSGALGLIAYLSIFAALGYYLISGYRRGKLNIHDFSILAALITGYFVQNLAVFDSLVTYMALMITLGYVYWLTEINDEEFEYGSDEPLVNKEIYTLAIAGVLCLTIMYQYNIKVLKMLIGTIDGQRDWAMGQVEQAHNDYVHALSYNTVLDRDSRTSMNRLWVSNPSALSKLDRVKAQEILDFNIEAAKKNVAYNKQDSLDQMMLSQVLAVAADFNRDDPEKRAYYYDQAVEAIDASIAASPRRTPVYFQKAQMQINAGDQEGAIETLRYSTTLWPDDYEPYCYLGRALLYYQKPDEGYQAIDRCIDIGGGSGLTPASFVKTLINHYSDNNDYDRLVKLFRVLTGNLEPKNVDNWVKLAMLYKQTGNIEEARAAAEKAIEIDPSIRQYAQDFLNGLGN